MRIFFQRSKWSIVRIVVGSQIIDLARRTKPNGNVKYFRVDRTVEFKGKTNYILGKQRHAVNIMSVIVPEVSRKQIIL